MLYILDNLDFILAIGGLVLLVVTIGLYVDYLFCRSNYYIRLVSPYAWPLIVLASIGGVAISLFYSEYLGFVPCSLCWLQRIALYPQALFALMALKTKENIYFPLYSIGLSLFGLAVAVYHYIEQLLPKEASVTGMVLPCLADGSADCATLVIHQFGFITFPLLSAITFAFLIVMYLNLRRLRAY